MNLNFRSLPCAALLFMALHQTTTSLCAQIPSIEVRALSQAVAQAGSQIELSIAAGEHTGDLQKLLFSTPGINAEQGSTPAENPSEPAAPSGIFKVTIPPQAPAGICEVRAVGRLGVSNPRALVITQQPVVKISADHSTLLTSQDLSSQELLTDKIIVAHCQPQKRNYYRISLSAGETLRVSCYAQALDSLATPTLSLLSPQSEELSRSRATGSWPAEISYQTQEAGEYYLAVHDFLFGGGVEYAYALEHKIDSGKAPPSPMELDQLLRPTLEGTATSFHIDQIAAHSIATEQVLANSQTPPFAIPFQLQSDLNQTTFDFRATQAQPLWIEVSSAAYGQLTDPNLILYQLPASQDTNTAAQPTRITQQDDAPQIGDAAVKLTRRDPQFVWTAPADGTYQLELRDNESGSRPAEATQFRVSATPLHPDFELLAYRNSLTNNPAASHPFGSNLLTEGAETIRILVVRKHGFSGAVEVSAEGLPDGLLAPPIVIPENGSEGSLTLFRAAESTAWMGPVQIHGHSQSDANTAAIAQPATIVWAASPVHNSVRSRLTSELWIGANSSEAAPLSAQLGSQEILEVAQGGKLSIPIQLHRQPGGQADCLFRPQHLPPKTSVADVTIAAAQSEGTIELVVAADAPIGEFTFWLQNETKIKWEEKELTTWIPTLPQRVRITPAAP
ncbi:hypothetical protein [Aureliella helgolandensis]|nr:hypothetical protein [Aureliella helgolandensis]